VWERVWHAALAALDQQGKLDWSMAFLDGSYALAKRGSEKVGVCKKGKGTQWMLLIDGHGLPLGFHLNSANTAEVKLAEQTFDTIEVTRQQRAVPNNGIHQLLVLSPSSLPFKVSVCEMPHH
jgi:hypothetical protein